MAIRPRANRRHRPPRAIACRSGTKFYRRRYPALSGCRCASPGSSAAIRAGARGPGSPEPEGSGVGGGRSNMDIEPIGGGATGGEHLSPFVLRDSTGHRFLACAVGEDRRPPCPPCTAGRASATPMRSPPCRGHNRAHRRYRQCAADGRCSRRAAGRQSRGTRGSPLHGEPVINVLVANFAIHWRTVISDVQARRRGLPARRGSRART